MASQPRTATEETQMRMTHEFTMSHITGLFRLHRKGPGAICPWLAEMADWHPSQASKVIESPGTMAESKPIPCNFLSPPISQPVSRPVPLARPQTQNA
jgi:hypothetical protein